MLLLYSKIPINGYFKSIPLQRREHFQTLFYKVHRKQHNSLSAFHDNKFLDSTIFKIISVKPTNSEDEFLCFKGNWSGIFFRKGKGKQIHFKRLQVIKFRSSLVCWDPTKLPSHVISKHCVFNKVVGFLTKVWTPSYEVFLHYWLEVTCVGEQIF